jgi:Skp family chaperone for outer membrane proteins
MKGLLVVAVGALLFIAHTRPEQKELKVGVVNIKECTEKCDFVKDVESKLKKDRDVYAKQIDEMDKEVQKLEDQWKGAPPESELRMSRYIDWMNAKAKREAAYKINAVKLTSEWQRSEVDFYNEILKVSELKGKELGFDMVIRVGVTPTEGKEEGQDLKILSHRIRYETLIYYSPTIDITQKVIERLNEEYKKKKAEKKNGQ